jgi:flagellar hook assembly protein FlgD
LQNIELPTEWSLSSNYPNPFNSQTNFEIRVPERNFMNLSIYDILGRKVAEIYSGEIEAGVYKFNWNGREVASGTYFAKLSVESKDKIKNQIQVKKLLYLK